MGYLILSGTVSVETIKQGRYYCLKHPTGHTIYFIDTTTTSFHVIKKKRTPVMLSNVSFFYEGKAYQNNALLTIFKEDLVVEIPKNFYYFTKNAYATNI